MNVIYPGSFDPVTNGHIDIIKRCAKKFDKVTVAVLNNNSKNGFLPIEKRLELLKETTKHINNVEIDSFSGLLIDYAKMKDINIIVKGLRAVSDFENEMKMALANNKLYPELETLFMVSNTRYSYLSSSLVRELSVFGGDVSCLVPKAVEEALIKKFQGGL
ncbi:MAG: pantetheine-phosphate adenylyltransferase [Tissierellia bacterium]|nr:pantetheine-phosphate adenylyltransferase [Tissierellia bacterium]MDD4725753.1 pantetheine-phosphate adenylyltransferase [Tissierellia bacterium]